MGSRQRRVVLSLLLLAVVASTLLYGYRGDYGNYSWGRGSRSPPPRPPPYSLHNNGDSDRSDGASYHYSSPNSSVASVWTDEEISQLPKLPYPKHGELIAESHQHTGQSRADRLRYESGDIWRSDSAVIDQDTGVAGLNRFKVPPRSEFSSDGQYLRQSIPGDFKYGADKLFMMVKTGADTQWSRMPMHFLTDLTHAKNFALYSDSPGSIFGHEIIDIIRDLPEDVIESEWELKRYKAHLQSHDEHWNWAPEQLKGDGGWMVDRYKNIPMLYDAYKKNPNCDWYLWVDDDSYVFYDTMVKWLDTMNPRELVYTGATAGLRYEGELIYFAHGGSVVAVSNAIAEALFGPPEKRKHSMTDKEFLDKWAHLAVPICCGDALFAHMLIKELDTILYTHPDFGQYLWFGGAFQGESPQSLLIPSRSFCTPVASWHHLKPHDMEVLYSYERLWSENRAILYDDIYRDFYLPYIVEERPNWKIASSGVPENYPSVGQEPNQEVTYDGKKYKPALNKQDCIDLCRAKPACSGWTWKPKYCMLQTSGFAFGAAANEWNEDKGYVSGWMVDRIREWRAESHCDPLKKVGNKYNDDESTSEGWMLRKLAREQQPKHSFEKDSTLPK